MYTIVYIYIYIYIYVYVYVYVYIIYYLELCVCDLLINMMNVKSLKSHERQFLPQCSACGGTLQ